MKEIKIYNQKGIAYWLSLFFTYINTLWRLKAECVPRVPMWHYIPSPHPHRTVQPATKVDT